MGPSIPEPDIEGPTTFYYGIYGGDRSLSRVDVEEAIGDAGVVTRFTAAINLSPASGSWTFTFMRNGKAQLSCTIQGANRKCSVTGYVPLLSTDRVVIEMTPGDGDAVPLTMFSTAAFQLKYSLD